MSRAKLLHGNNHKLAEEGICRIRLCSVVKCQFGVSNVFTQIPCFTSATYLKKVIHSSFDSKMEIIVMLMFAAAVAVSFSPSIFISDALELSVRHTSDWTTLLVWNYFRT